MDEEIHVEAIVDGRASVVVCRRGTVLREALLRLGVGQNDCGGSARCGRCRVRFSKNPPPFSAEDEALIPSEELASGWRLACCAYPLSGSQVEVRTTREAEMRIVTHRTGGVSDVHRTAALACSELGISVDIGTTTVVCYVIEPATGAECAVVAFPNPQRTYGADVISRIQFAHAEESHLVSLQRCLTRAIDREIALLCKRDGIEAKRIQRLLAVGNSTMMHLLWGVDPWPLGVAPHQPVFAMAQPRSGRDLGFRFLSDVQVEMLPGISGHLGADTTAGCLTLDPGALEGPTLFMDLGTNGEIVLFSGEEAIGCTTAAGPAFEGVNISCGVPAVQGAIDRVEIAGDALRLGTIGGIEPTGLCGSGLADAVTALLAAGLLLPSGRFEKRDAPGVPDALARRLRTGSPGFTLHETADRSLVLGQMDVRQVQFAKAAFRTGIDFLLREAGLLADDVKRVFVGGGFGSHLRPDSLIGLGILPETMRDRTESIGNAAGTGACLALKDDRQLRRAGDIARAIRVIALESVGDFMQHYTSCLAFPAPVLSEE